ncbi:hypothetical protein BgiBS90_001443 [Biomphalaria glabrata]|nr:hypothetical protein BgiBS90_001443 [Biomphalaria glabrata]
MNNYSVYTGIIVISAGTLVAVGVGVALWKLFKRNSFDDEASQLCRLVSPRRSKDDDRRLLIKRRREYRLRNPKTDSAYHERLFKRQNTM